tara:strand:- start:242 stop:685 length:444 start_codon:yes stop_codon:yes gene_type:complete
MFDLTFIAREFLAMVGNKLDKHTSEKSFVKIGIADVTLFTPSHVQFAAYGRGPGKKPPLDPILKWVKREGIIFSGTDARGTAFAIQNSISKKGTKNWQPNAPNVIDEAIKEELSNYSKALASMFMFQVNGEVKKFNEENFKDTKFKI